MALFSAESQPPFYLSKPLFFHVLADYFVSFGQSRVSHKGEHLCNVLLAVFFCVFFNALCCLFPMRPSLKASSTDVVIYFLAIFFTAMWQPIILETKKMPRLTKQMAEKLDLEIKAYWQKEHEKTAEARREKERKYRRLAISRAARAANLEANKAASPSCSAFPLERGLGHSASPPKDSN